jgi:hypothetical protein
MYFRPSTAWATAAAIPQTATEYRVFSDVQLTLNILTKGTLPYSRKNGKHVIVFLNTQ